MLKFSFLQGLRTTFVTTAFALNTAANTSTGKSAYEIVFGKAPTLPIDILFDTPSIPYLEDSQKIRSEVKHNLLRAQNQYTKAYNKKHVAKAY